MKKHLFTIALMTIALFAKAQMKPDFNDTTCFTVSTPYTGIGFAKNDLLIFTANKEVFENVRKNLGYKMVNFKTRSMKDSWFGYKEYTMYFRKSDSTLIRRWGNRNL